VIQNKERPVFFGKKAGSGMTGYHFTDEVREVLSGARTESIRLRHEYVGTEHILLSLSRQESGAAGAILRELRVKPADIRSVIHDTVKTGNASVSGTSELPYTSRSKKVLELAMTAARNLGDNYVGSEHILLGMIDEGKGIAAQVLSNAGATAERTGEALLRLRGELDSAPEASFEFQVDDTSEQSIYEQIVAQAQEAVATGKLQPGERLPTVRQLADELDIAPGTVARAYSELERLGVVITEGKRGTRVAERERPAIPQSERPAMLVGLLRPVVVAAFHLGATGPELREALDVAMKDIYK
jgi:DNA-binding transcriptional regulator YhcF (GntR family)